MKKRKKKRKKKRDIDKENLEMDLYICFLSLAPSQGFYYSSGGKQKKLEMFHAFSCFPCSIVTLWSCLFLVLTGPGADLKLHSMSVHIRYIIFLS